MKELHLEVRNLQKYYGEGRRVRVFQESGCNLKIYSGEIYVILGGSGCGKSTLFRAILGVIPSEGYVSIKAPYSFLLTQNHFDLDSTLRDNFYEYYRSFGLEFELFEEYVERNQALSLDNLSKECSYGTLRRFALYRTLFQKSKLYFLDEPTTGFDFQNILKIKDLLLRKPPDTSYFIVTHDKTLAGVATHYYLMSQKNHLISKRTRGGLLRLEPLSLSSPLDLSLLRRIYRNDTEKFQIFYTSDLREYERVGKSLREGGVPHRSIWLDGSNFDKFVDFYFD